MPTEAKPVMDKTPAQKLLDDHLALTLSGLVLCAMTIKVLIVAHGDPVTSASIVSQQGLAGLASIMFAVGLPSIATLLVILAASSLGEALREGDSLTGPAITLGVALLLAAFFSPQSILLFVSAYSLVIVLISWVIVFLRERVSKSWLRGKNLPFMLRKSNYPQRLPASRLLALASFLALGSLVLNDSIWLPKEQLTVTKAVVTGYVISGDGDFMHLILDHNRQTVVLKTSEIEKRALCEPSDDRSLPMRIFWPHSLSYADCD